MNEIARFLLRDLSRSGRRQAARAPCARVRADDSSHSIASRRLLKKRAREPRFDARTKSWKLVERAERSGTTAARRREYFASP
jgi:hypothetical protein